MAFLIRFMDDRGQIELHAPTLANAQRIVDFLERSNVAEIKVFTIDGEPVDIDRDASQE